MDESSNVVPVTKPGRLKSLDALRGFDMFWIMGADALGAAAAKLADAIGGPPGAGGEPPLIRRLADQLEHVPWEGFHFYDLIFPLFVFMAGVSLVYSLGRMVAEEGREAAAFRLFRRAFVLYILGVLYYGGWSKGLDQVRLLGVLQRIALSYFGAGLCFIYLRPRGWIVVLLGLLSGYWALLALVPVPGVGAGDFAEGRNLTNWIDSQYLPWRKWDGDHDPEGLLSTLPAIGTCLLGVFAGWLLRDESRTPPRRALLLLVAGVVLVALGWTWDLKFPVIKKLWTSSYVLVAGGYSALLLAAFYYVIDIRGWQRWCQPFIWVGLNPIAIYLASELVSFENLAHRVAGGPVAGWFDAFVPHLGGLVLALAGIAWVFLLARFLHNRRLYLRL